LSDVRGSFTRDVNNANKLQKDARLIANGLEAETIPKEYELLQSNNYRILSEVYKDVLALRTLNFTEPEIRELLSGRRALSEDDVNMVMLGTYNAENLPNFKENSAIQNTIKNINRELKTNYTIFDFVNQIKLSQIQQKYTAIPLGLSKDEREEFFRSTIDRKIDILEPKIEENIKLLDKQLKGDQSSLSKPPLPASNFLPDPQISNMFAANIDPISGLTETESRLLSPEEQIIAKRLRT